jgi:hypothetical protein
MVVVEKAGSALLEVDQDTVDSEEQIHKVAVEKVEFVLLVGLGTVDSGVVTHTVPVELVDFELVDFAQLAQGQNMVAEDLAEGIL